MKDSKFIIRVYGIHIDPHKGVLVSDEYFKERYFTKFPGGGLEYGEGTIECLIREMKEETSGEFRILSHFYTTDFFIKSAFNESQVISVYYIVKSNAAWALPVKTMVFDFDGEGDVLQSFRWVKVDELNEGDFLFPTDQQVVKLLLKES